MEIPDPHVHQEGVAVWSRQRTSQERSRLAGQKSPERPPAEAPALPLHAAVPKPMRVFNSPANIRDICAPSRRLS